ncbi:hypothetical protein A2V80_03675 [Candidatus Woesebacteria bacterium RBG_16_39_8b]|uniref:Uncharacterized protein n=1 Tax=Candidatus Woesebacteria bacterium RBG_16_39_8b TaxID=1802482 RepID=A0A1F7XFI5_9BACT|nr:MAG: hypothetical protein A2V80_03675 [Candidatus Woesebacteria bacterium RBG_16_39_8b]
MPRFLRRGLPKAVPRFMAERFIIPGSPVAQAIAAINSKTDLAETVFTFLPVFGLTKSQSEPLSAFSINSSVIPTDIFVLGR